MYSSDDRWQKINQIFFAAMNAAPEHREQLLNQLCSHDSSLLREVASLISADSRAGKAFLQQPGFEIYQQWLGNPARHLMEGREFGPYRVLRKIGHGGMAEVYLGEWSDHQCQKQVAIKVIRKELDNTWGLRRFCTERQILADLDHPYISRLLDGGTTEDGVPYLVMEYIEGKRIDSYCDANRLSIVERLQLFLKVCSAVYHAHLCNVIHRDLKPGNILITAEGNPKLLDFGVAKLMNPDVLVQSLSPTVTGAWLMTPEYASPEQVQGQAASVSTDIYSLGVLLYELLSGHLPYPVRNLLPHQILHTICEIEPARPSVVGESIEDASLSRRNATTLDPETISELRGERPEQLRRHLSGDLDNIILMALRKEPQHRYSSVELFAQDIRRYLENLPVVASKYTLSYHARKYIRRYRLQITVAVLLLAFLIGGTFVNRWHEEKEQQRNRTELLHRLNNIMEAHDEGSGLVVNVSSVNFNPGRVYLSAEARERVAKIAGIILAYQNLAVRIEGYTDDQGASAYNLAISQERTQAVKAYLISQGIPPNMITASGLGSTHPIMSNETAAGRQRNRRVEIIVSGDVIGEHISSSSSPTSWARPLNLPDTDSQVLQPMYRSETDSNFALHKVSTSSALCNANEGPEKAFNGSVSTGSSDKWCSYAMPSFLQVDLGRAFMVNEFIVRHASAGQEPPVLNTRDFNIQISTNGRDFATAVRVTANSKGVSVHTIPATLARFVRLNVLVPSQHGDNFSRIYELEVHCDSTKMHHSETCLSSKAHTDN